jgi:hypothetical protein
MSVAMVWYSVQLCYNVGSVLFQRVGTESVTFLSTQENNGTLYSIPGLLVTWFMYQR